MIKYWEAQFNRIRNDMIRAGIYPATATIIIRQKIIKGILPKELLDVLENRKKKYKPKSSIRQKFSNNTALKNSIFERDGFKCFKCKGNNHLVVHHIHSLKLYPELAEVPENLVLLCRKCHKKAHSPEAC